MGLTRSGRRVVAQRAGSDRLHRLRVSAEQRLHLTAVLILILAAPAAAQDFDFDPTITQEQFQTFSALVGQAIFPTPVNPGDPGGLLGFDIGIAGTAIPIDEEAQYWTRSVDSDILRSGYLVVPRLVASKGIGLGNLSASYAQIPDTDVKILGGSFDLPILRGGVLSPTLVIRASYGQLQGVDEFELTTYGGEVVFGKAFGPITPYVAGGLARIDATGHIEGFVTGVPIDPLRAELEQERYTAGLRLSLFLLKFVAEATRAEETTYAAKVSFGF